MFRRPLTHRDPLGSFALVRSSPFDSIQPSQTSETCMACMGRHCGRRLRATTRPRSSPVRSMMNSRSSDASMDGTSRAVVPVARRGASDQVPRWDPRQQAATGPGDPPAYRHLSVGLIVLAIPWCDTAQSPICMIARRGGHGSAQFQDEDRDWCRQKYREDEVAAPARAVASKGLRAPGATRPELPLSGRLAIVALQAREHVEHRCHPGHFRTQGALDIIQSFPFARKQIHVVQVWSVSDCRIAEPASE